MELSDETTPEEYEQHVTNLTNLVNHHYNLRFEAEEKLDAIRKLVEERKKLNREDSAWGWSYIAIYTIEKILGDEKVKCEKRKWEGCDYCLAELHGCELRGDFHSSARRVKT